VFSVADIFSQNHSYTTCNTESNRQHVLVDDDLIGQICCVLYSISYIVYE